jgi:predicted TIM-barrel fold metal-dependent hydrolase
MSNNNVPIFDCLTHPTLDGSWLNPKAVNGGNRFPEVSAALRAANVRWAWAVALGNSGGYDSEQYVKACAQAEVRFFPAAFLSPNDFPSLAAIEAWLFARKAQGFLGIKLHPRLAHFTLDHQWLPDIIAAANRLELTVLLCTYFYTSDPALRTLSLESLHELLHATCEHKIILLHGATVRLLELSEMTRPFKHVLLDLSFTLCEFAGSSIDLDLRYVMDRCRGRVCLGSDSPEFTPKRFRDRFEQLTAGFEREHLERLAFRNLFDFTGLPSDLTSHE